MPKGGQLTLETAIVDLTKETESPFQCGDFVPGEYVLINIADTGIGMNDEAKAHLFEPFFTTKADRERSGLGLATCYGIVHQAADICASKANREKARRCKFISRVCPRRRHH